MCKVYTVWCIVIITTSVALESSAPELRSESAEAEKEFCFDVFYGNRQELQDFTV